MSPSKALPIVTGTIVVAAAAAVAWFVFATGEPDHGASSSPAVVSQEEQAEAPAELTAPARMDTPTPTATLAEGAASSPREEVAAPEEETEELDWMAEGVQWLEGRVALAANTPIDERAVVFAVEGAATAPELFDDGRPGERASEPEPELRRGLVSVAPVEPDGSFKIALPVRADTIHLAVSGRYLFSRATTEVALPAARPPVLVGELGSWISGVVRPPAGTPEGIDMEGLELELGPDVTAGFNAMAVAQQAWEHEDATDADGAFEFRAVNPAIGHGVVVRSEDFAGLVQLGIHPAAGEHLRLEIVLSEGATIRGRVVDDDRSPVAEASVSANLPGVVGRAIGDVRSTQTDEEGLFELTNVATGSIELMAEREGFLDARKMLEAELVDHDVIESLELTLDRGRTISGRVLFQDGKPAAGAFVRAGPDLARATQMDGMAIGTASRANTETDEEGRFSMSGLSTIAYKVTASIKIEEGEHAGDWQASASGVRDEEPLEITLEGLTSLAGRVTDRLGDPVTAFEVLAKPKASGMAGLFAGFERQVSPFEDEDGRFVLDRLEAGSWEVRVRATGMASALHDDVTLPRAETDGELVFVMEPAAAVEGVVLDTGGNPASGAQVALDVDLGTRMNARLGQDLPSAISDHEGRFELELDPGQHSLIASLEGFAPSATVSCEARAGELTEGVVLTLRLGGVLTGVVMNDEGEPDTDRMVIVQNMPSYSTQHMVATDADGAFRVEHLEPGDWQVIAMANFMSTATAEAENNMGDLLGSMKMDFVEIADGEETHVILGAPPEDPVTLKGRVTHAGAPLGEGIVSAMPDDAEGLKDMKIQSLQDDGTFEMELSRPGTYRITVQITSGATQQNNTELLERIPEDVEEFELDIEMPVGRVSGRVTGPDGDPISGCRVTLNAEGAAYGAMMGGHYVEAATDEAGRYDIEYLRPGTYTVGAGGLAFGGLLGGTTDAGRVVRAGIRVDEGEWVDALDFRLPKPGNIAGSVVDLGGQPVPDAVVFLRDEEGDLVETFSLSTTDSGGRFHYEGLSPGRYTVSARTKKLVAAESDLVRVSESETVETRLTLSSGTMLRVTVIDKTGEELGTHLSVIDANDREYGSMRSLREIMEGLGTNFDGKEHRIGPVPPGTYTLVATTDDGRKSKKSVTVGNQEERRVKLRLK